MQFDPEDADMWTDYAGWVGKFAGQSFPATDGFYKVVRNEPLGVVAGYGPRESLLMAVLAFFLSFCFLFPNFVLTIG